MPGHGSPPPADRSDHDARVVTRDSGMRREGWADQVGDRAVIHTVEEYRPPYGGFTHVTKDLPMPKGAKPGSERGTRFRWSVNSGDVTRSGDVRTMQRAKAASRSAQRRYFGGEQ